jgi:hypothetical protein
MVARASPRQETGQEKAARPVESTQIEMRFIPSAVRTCASQFATEIAAKPNFDCGSFGEYRLKFSVFSIESAGLAMARGVKQQRATPTRENTMPASTIALATPAAAYNADVGDRRNGGTFARAAMPRRRSWLAELFVTPFRDIDDRVRTSKMPA